MKYRGYDDSQDRIPFNSSLAFLERIERRWENADQAKVEGDTATYFRVLEVIYINTHPFFTGTIKDESGEERPETDVCEEMIVEIEELLSKKSVGGSTGRKFMEDDVWVGENKCDKLRKLLVKLLFKYKITYHSAEAKNWQEELSEDFR